MSQQFTLYIRPKSGLVTTFADETEVEGDYGTVAGLEVTCRRCGHTVEVFGTSDASWRAGCCMLRDECPRKENNYYVTTEEHPHFMGVAGHA